MSTSLRTFALVLYLGSQWTDQQHLSKAGYLNKRRHILSIFNLFFSGFDTDVAFEAQVGPVGQENDQTKNQADRGNNQTKNQAETLSVQAPFELPPSHFSKSNILPCYTKCSFCPSVMPVLQEARKVRTGWKVNKA